MSTPEPPAAAPHSEVGHRVSLRVLVTTLVALLILTAITVGVTRLPWSLGRTLGLWVALTIATVKATLVVLYFMHVRYNRPVIGLILVLTLFLVAVFISITLVDSLNYQDTIESWRAEDTARYAPDLQSP
jgi:cytochrome c oxidase subunit IV